MEKAAEYFREYLKGKGLRMTRPREVILKAFLRNEGHLGLDELYSKIKRNNSGIGFATVWRTLNLLKAAQIASQVNFAGRKARYEHKFEHAHHDHLVCVKCGRLTEVVDPKIEKLQEKLAKKNKFKALSHRMEIFGECARCLVWFLVFIALLAAPALAARPLATDDVPVVAPGVFEIEEGVEYGIPRGNAPSTLFVINSIKRGILPFLDLGIEFPLFFGNPSGVGDLAFKGKYQFNDGYSLGFNLKSASADQASGLGSGNPEYQVYLIRSLELSGALAHFNLGGTFSQRNTYLLYRAALECPLHRSFGSLVFEVVGAYDPNLPILASPFDILVGLIKIAVDDLFILDLGLDFGLTESSPAYRGVVGLTWRVK